MIENIDTDRVCGHVKSLLLTSMPIGMVEEVVGYLNNLKGQHYEQFSKDLGHIFVKAFLGEFLIPKEDIPTVGIENTNQLYLDRYGNPTSGNRYKLDWLNYLLRLPGGDRETQQIWSGLSKLQSACIIKTASKSEEDEVVKTIFHTTSIDPEILQSWRTFVDEYTPYLIDRLGISSERKYNTIFSTPYNASKSTAILNPDMTLSTAKRGSRKAVDPTYQLQHPLINELCSLYPTESACSLFLGYTERGSVTYKSFPPAHHRDIPIGIMCPIPKIAEKMRFVLVVLSMLDSMSRPTFHKLEEFETLWNTQAVMDQDGARLAIQRRLTNKVRRSDYEEVVSIDQSSFTDNFSYTFIQRQVLYSLVYNGILTDYDLAVVDGINYGAVDATRIGWKHEPIYYGTGTGMGSPPSFPLASLCNSYMLAYCYKLAHGKFHDPTRFNRYGLRIDPPGYVVGDDIIIFDPQVGALYSMLCEKIGLQINKSKSFSSSDTAEFCGKIITPQGIFDRKKLKPITDLASISKTIEYYGDNYKPYFEEYSNVTGFDFTSLAEKLRNFPKPFGAKEFEIGKYSYQELSIEEKLATLLYETSKLSSLINGVITPIKEDISFVPSGFGLEKHDVEVHLKRVRKGPSIVIKDHEVITSDSEIDVKEIPIFMKSLARDALNLWEEIQMQSTDRLVEDGRLIDEIFDYINQFSPKFWEEFEAKKDTLIPKRNPTLGSEVPEEILRFWNSPKVNTPDNNEKEVPSYE